ncbi:MAG: alpha/beta hydrolase [Clostridia bacterium]|nr:alpha/beta hydrolase [Clostridia bacterium]
MTYQRIPLSSSVYPEKDNVYLEAYVPDKLPHCIRPAILVIPGGGYGCVCSDREGEPIALAFIAQGYAAFVLHYSVARSRVYPAQLCEASLAMAHIRTHADAYGIDPGKVFVTGFSAGGHLAGSLGIFWHRQEVYDATGLEYGINRPDGMMLAYPVVSSDCVFSHSGSFKNLLGTDEPTEEQLEYVSLEKHVDEHSASLYIMHTSNDAVVPVKNALVLAEAYAKAGRTFELHIYPDAPHGAALGNHITWSGNPKFDNAAIAKWIENAAFWAQSLSE